MKRTKRSVSKMYESTGYVAHLDRRRLRKGIQEDVRKKWESKCSLMQWVLTTDWLMIMLSIGREA